MDGKAFVQELYWVRELGERIGRQPDIEPAAVDLDVVVQARQVGTNYGLRTSSQRKTCCSMIISESRAS